MLTGNDVLKIRHFVYRNARPIDLYRWQHHMENTSAQQIYQALSAYQNPDGGFGHALEADAWNPHSTPIQTSTAAHILWDNGLLEKNHPLVWGILQYLDSGKDMAEHRWLNIVPSNNDYPHAPWWEMESVSTSHSEFNPTAILAGAGLYFAPERSSLFVRCKKIAGELIAAFLSAPEISMHSLLCVESLMNWIKKAGLISMFPMEDLEAQVLVQENRLMQSDKDKWDGYACRPSEFIHTPQHPLYAQNKELVERELDWLEEKRNADGVWEITWSWAGYDKAFAISENWWKVDIAIRNMRYLKAFGRLQAHMHKFRGNEYDL